MYFPYLRGKLFELEALLEVSGAVFSNTIPIIEPVANASRARNLYKKVAARNFPVILITNPFYPQDTRISMSEFQKILDEDFAINSKVTVGFLIDSRFQRAELTSFLSSYPSKPKAIIFRFGPISADITAIQTALATTSVDYLIFDESKANLQTRNSFSTFANRVLLTDGFQRQSKNADYPAVSAFDTRLSHWREDGWTGIGDYLTIGDIFNEGGGPVYVVTLHLTIKDGNDIEVHHFSSTVHANTKGLAAQKFSEANNFLVTSPTFSRVSSTGLDLYRDWHQQRHNPHLGAAKKASIIHHIELMSTLI